MSNIPYGLSALMEATKQSERSQRANDALMEAFEDAIEDEVIAAVTGQDDDSLESDMDGEGVGDEEELQRLVDKIPPSDEMDEAELDNVMESFFAELEGAVAI